MTEPKDDQTTVNDSGTQAHSDTNVTRYRSRDVHPAIPASINLDIENTRRNLVAKRNAAGADSEIGHRCSNLIEQLENYRTAEGDQKANLAKLIERTLKELAERHQ